MPKAQTIGRGKWDLRLMRAKRLKIKFTQLRLAFAEGSRGKAPRADRQPTEPLTTIQTPESPAGKERLMVEVCDRDNLEVAWKRLRRNIGSSSVDRPTMEKTLEYLRIDQFESL
jgi:RNA-directed DNA polymerase